MYSTNDANYNTPSRFTKAKEQMSTGINYGKQTESHIRPSQYGEGDKLTKIEAQIRKIGDQLRQLHTDMLLQTDKYSQKYILMEKQRAQLRKMLIDLDFEYKAITSESIKQTRVRQEEQIAKTRADLQTKLKETRKKQEENSEELQQLASERRKARMAQIEADLAESRLRRSRIANLNAQLDYLRLTYRDPSLWRFYYSLDYLPSYYYYYYPTYLSDYYYPYTYSSYYYSPYRYSYLYPYSYWRLYY